MLSFGSHGGCCTHNQGGTERLVWLVGDMLGIHTTNVLILHVYKFTQVKRRYKEDTHRFVSNEGKMISYKALCFYI